MHTEKTLTKQKICILGTLHQYQHQAFRSQYIQTVRDLIEIHSVDLVAEEASGVQGATYARELLSKKFKSGITWRNVDLTAEERKAIPDANPCGYGTLQDFDFNMAREKAWVARTSDAMKASALLICGWAHLFSVAAKFREAGFEIELHVFFDSADAERIK